MTLYRTGLAKLAQKQKDEKIATAFPNGIKCQKCLEMGHWSYECKNKRKYVHRSSRTKVLNKRINELNGNSGESNNEQPPTKRLKSSKSNDDESSKSSSDSSSSDSSSDSNSSSSSSSEDSDSDSSSSSSSSSDSESDSSEG